MDRDETVVERSDIHDDDLEKDPARECTNERRRERVARC